MSFALAPEANLGPMGMISSFWRNRSLILRLSRREIEGRYKGSLLGIGWAVLVPLLLLVVYTFIFSVVFQARWDSPIEGKGHFALFVFSALLLFNVLSECVNRAPSLMFSNVAYVKKVVFPLETLPWIILLAALFNALVSMAILLVGYLAILGMPPLSSLTFPFFVIPLSLITLGATFILASVGVFVRDLQQIVGVAITVLLFMSPIFFPVTALPETLRKVLLLSPLTWIIEGTRAALFYGQYPSLVSFALVLVSSWLFAWMGFWWFMRTKKGFADVI